ncbi:MAG: hypothetical protein IJF65_01605, partial [Clostridia bacterium]|nr:hypothetical protein [Clostridia bacterium]
EVLSLEDDYALCAVGEDEGYIETAHLTYQNDAPVGKPTWISQPGHIAQTCDLYETPEINADLIGQAVAGDPVTVTVIQDDFCLVATAEGCGYAPISSVILDGPADSDEAFDALDPMAAVEMAQTALAKGYKTFDDVPLYYQIAATDGQDGLEGSLYVCGFFSDDDQYLYGALIDAEQEKVVFTASYQGFALPSDDTSLLPEGEAMLTLSTNHLSVGEVLDIEVTAWTKHQCQYTLYRNGKSFFTGEPTDHFTAAYRPRQTGNYQLTVTVTDKEGLSCSVSEDFTVDASDDQGLYNVYSQKDGWWLDKPYRKSDLDQSGCAIFALAHALNRMDITGDDTHPTNLADTFSLCLTADGTNNERLLREASEIYGFKTARDLIENKKKIAQLLNEGCLFSFSVCRGHIAMISGISEDGKMVRVVDSAPSATIERLVNASIYYQTRSGSYRIASTLEDIPEARWYFETNNYGGLEYWMTLDYAARRGVRLIQP